MRDTTKGTVPGKNDRSTEADAKSTEGASGQRKPSSRDAKSHEKAGRDTGAGGGKKQERHH